MIDTILSNYATSLVIEIRDLNIHKKNWLKFSKTDPPAAEMFVLNNNVNNIIHEHTWCSRITNIILKLVK